MKMQKIVKRRKGLLTFIPVLFISLSIGALYIIEPQYESSIAVLVQKEKTLNPFIFNEMAVNIVSQDRVKSFNEIIYSRSTIEKLIDSLSLDDGVKSELEKQELVEEVRENIKTESPTSDSFEITYYDADPVRARDGVKLLSNHFMETRLKLESKRNAETVKYFENKVAELEDIVNKQRSQLVDTNEQTEEVPIDQEVLQSNLQSIENQQIQLDWRVIQEENKLRILEEFLNQDNGDFSIKPLYKLQLSEIPLGQELGELLDRYDVLRQRYTDNYPELSDLQTRILETANRIYPAIESNLSNLETQQVALKEKRESLINDLEKSFIAERQKNSQQSDFSIYQDLYDEMKVKLEQAHITRDVGDQGKEQYMILDPPYVPQRPTSPDHALVVTGGFFLGLLFAGIAVAIAEAFDTRIRREEDLRLKKPVIAYLKDGKT